jgi:hypothetical protein
LYIATVEFNHFSNQDRVSFVISLHPGFPYPCGRHQWIQKPMEVRTWDTWDNVKPIPVHGCQAVDWFCCPSCINSTSNSIYYIMVACSSKKNFWSLVGTPKPTRENSCFFPGLHMVSEIWGCKLGSWQNWNGTFRLDLSLLLYHSQDKFMYKEYGTMGMHYYNLLQSIII